MLISNLIIHILLNTFCGLQNLHKRGNECFNQKPSRKHSPELFLGQFRSQLLASLKGNISKLDFGLQDQFKLFQVTLLIHLRNPDTNIYHIDI